MRSTIVAVSILGAAVLSPTLAAPASAIHHKPDSVSSRQASTDGGLANTKLLDSRSIPGLGIASLITRDHSPRGKSSSSSWSIMPREFWKKAGSNAQLNKRLGDNETMGGNAHSGKSGSVNGGSVYNPDPTNNQDMPVLMNMNSNNAGIGGQSTSGCANSGKSGEVGTGGNASSGDSGNAMGGNVEGPPSGMVNMNSNNGGSAGQSTTGCAIGGDTFDPNQGKEVVTEEIHHDEVTLEDPNNIPAFDHEQ